MSTTIRDGRRRLQRPGQADLAGGRHHLPSAAPARPGPMERQDQMADEPDWVSLWGRLVEVRECARRFEVAMGALAFLDRRKSIACNRAI